MERRSPNCARANGCPSEVGPREGSVGLRDAGVQCTGRRSRRLVARRLGAVVAGLLVVAGTTTVFDASSAVLGSAPPSETLSCNDNWVGGGTAGDWDSAANWSTGVPNGTGVDVCISGNANVTLSDATHSVGELTVSAGSSLTIGTAATGPADGAELDPLVRPAEQRFVDCRRHAGRRATPVSR